MHRCFALFLLHPVLSKLNRVVIADGSRCTVMLSSDTKQVGNKIATTQADSGRILFSRAISRTHEAKFNGTSRL